MVVWELGGGVEPRKRRQQQQTSNTGPEKNVENGVDEEEWGRLGAGRQNNAALMLQVQNKTGAPNNNNNNNSRPRAKIDHYPPPDVPLLPLEYR